MYLSDPFLICGNLFVFQVLKTLENIRVKYGAEADVSTNEIRFSNAQIRSSKNKANTEK